MVWDQGNTVDTSSRRLQRGLIYSVVVSFFVYYLLTYWMNRLTSRPLFGTAPAFRHERIARFRPQRVSLRIGVVLALLATVSLAAARFGLPAAMGGISRFLASR